jgi:hypothetical protein
VHGAPATASDKPVSLEDLRARIEKMKGQLEAEYLTLATEKMLSPRERIQKGPGKN